MFKQTLIASALLAAAVGAQAQSAGFSMTGSITPASCTLTLGSSGTAAYGTQAATTVRALPVATGTNNHYNMGSKTLTWTVACTATTPVQLAFTDNQAGKVTAIDTADVYRYGLVDGASGTTSIGSYTVTFTDAASTTVDGAPTNNFLHATSGATSWAANATTYTAYSTPGKATGFIKTAGLTAPSTLTNANGTLTITTALKKAYADAATSAITLNGSGTITLQYL